MAECKVEELLTYLKERELYAFWKYFILRTVNFTLTYFIFIFNFYNFPTIDLLYKAYDACSLKYVKRIPKKVLRKSKIFLHIFL